MEKLLIPLHWAGCSNSGHWSLAVSTMLFNLSNKSNVMPNMHTE